MFEELDRAAASLRDAKAGWVTRRDAVETLGGAALRALESLRRHAREPDVDVRSAVQKALSRATAALEGVQPESEPYTLDQLVQGLEKEGERSVQRQGDGYVVDVKLKSGRSQQVYVSPCELREGAPLIRILTKCGTPTKDAYGWALRANLKLAHGAIALREEKGEEQFVLLNSFLASETTPLEMRNSVKEIAYYGDWIESKLSSGQDDL